MGRCAVRTQSLVRVIYAFNVQGVDFGDSADVITRKFGTDAKMTSSKDGVRRVYAYPQYHVMFGLYTNKVQLIGIFDPAAPVPISPQADDELDDAKAESR
jgi:hypothetical protein